jgi:hypothetical protein
MKKLEILQNFKQILFETIANYMIIISTFLYCLLGTFFLCKLNSCALFVTEIAINLQRQQQL